MGILVTHVRSLVADKRGILSKHRSGSMYEGVHGSLFHGRSDEFDDLRPYQVSDDVRDIDWKATAKTGFPLVKRFIANKQHTMILIADIGVGMSTLTPEGETKINVALNSLGLFGLNSLSNGDELGLVYGDSRTSDRVKTGRGEPHLELILRRIHQTEIAYSAVSDITKQLNYVISTVRKRSIIVIASETPELSEELLHALRILRSRHNIFWLMVEDEDLVTEFGSLPDAVAVENRRRVLRRGINSKKVVREYQEAEFARKQALHDALSSLNISFTHIASSADVVNKFLYLTKKKT